MNLKCLPALSALLLCASVWGDDNPDSQWIAVRDSYPQLSPDGQRIVFQSNRSGSNQVWVMDRDGGNPVQLTQASGEGAETPAWSPDGTQIVYALYLAEGNNDVFVMQADGSGQRQLTFEPGYDDHPSWSRDGRIVFNSDRETPDPSLPWHQRWHDIWVMNADGGEATRLTDCRSTCTFGSLSPDGARLLYRRVDDSPGLNWVLERGERNSEIYLANADGSDARNLSPHEAFDGWPAWSGDGRWIAFASNRDGPAFSAQLWLVRPDGSGLRQLTEGDWGHVQPSFGPQPGLLTAFRFQERNDIELGGVTLIHFQP